MFRLSWRANSFRNLAQGSGLRAAIPRNALLLIAGLAGACSTPLSDGDCTALLDHYVELLVRSESPQTPSTELVHLKADARSKAARDPAFGRCSQQVSRREFRCAMQADTPDQLERCLL
jgi:hypothetical protein